MENQKAYSASNTRCSFLFICLWGCAEVTPMPQPVEKTTLVHGKVTTRYQEETVYVHARTFVKETPVSENKQNPQAQQSLKFPDGENVSLYLGQTYAIKPCKTTEIDLKQVLVTGGDLGSFADITCRNPGQKEMKAHFTCSGKELEFRTDINPYQLICVK